MKSDSISHLTDLESMERLERTMTQLNERIARLSACLQADIDSPSAISRILNREIPVLQHPVVEQVDEHGLHHSSAYRLHNDWEELRGLLALRYDIEADVLNDKGLKATTLMASHVENRLIRDGFKPGADGFDLLDQLQEKTMDS